MDLLFNKDGNGSQEVKDLLGWINRDMRFDDLKSDIKLETPRLIEYIGDAAYEEIVTNYELETTPEEYTDIIEYAQLFILCLAYLSYASNNDLQHGNNGRKQYKADNESAAWEWQIKADEGATMRRAYKALDRLIDLLNKESVQEWLDSYAFTKSQNLLIPSTDVFDNIHPIDNSGQLYYRMVPQMESIETEMVNAMLDSDLINRLKTATDLSADEKLIKLQAQRVTAFHTLSKAYQTFPLEMFPGDIDYAAGANYKHTVTGNKSIYFKEEAQHFELSLQTAYRAYKGLDADYDLPDNSDTNKKFINL
jgi:hypothetical protein